MKDIRVLHIDVENKWRGGQRQAMYLYESLRERGYKTHMFCKRHSKLHMKLIERGAAHTAIDYLGEFDLISAGKIANYARANDYNIIHCHSSHSLSLGLLAKFFFPKPKLIGVRRVDFPISGNFLSRWKYNTKKLDKLVCISDAIKEVMSGDVTNENKLVTIRSGVDIEKYKEANGRPVIEEFGLAGKIVVGTIAAFADHKDYPTLLGAAKTVLELRSGVVFLALGDGEKLEEMKSLASELDIADKFIFAGFRENVGAFLKAFDVYVMSSKEEGLGTSILDAMALALPIAATRAGGIPEIVKDGENGILCDIRSPEPLAEAIIKLIDDEKLRAEYGENSRELAKNFAIEKTVERNLELYGDALRDHSTS